MFLDIVKCRNSTQFEFESTAFDSNNNLDYNKQSFAERPKIIFIKFIFAYKFFAEF